MPEGHTVHRLAWTFTSLYVDQVLRVSSPQGRFAAEAAVLHDRRLVASEAWGKQLFLCFEGELWLRTHLGLYGAWTFAGAPGAPEVEHAIGAPRKRIGEREITVDVPASRSGVWVAPEPRGQVRVRLLGEYAVADLTGPSACEILTTQEKSVLEARLGPDPLRDNAEGENFVARVGRSRVTIGQQLMDQKVLAGVGNIYRAEVLFRAGVDPLRPGCSVPAATVRAIWDDLVYLMREGARLGAIVTTRPEDRHLMSGALTRRTRQNSDNSSQTVPTEQAFYVYHRHGRPCRICGEPVKVRDLAGRNLYWCGKCQT